MMDAGRFPSHSLVAALALGVLATAGCPDRTPVGDASVTERGSFDGMRYRECSELDCARACPHDAGTLRGECRWESNEMVCRCVEQGAVDCDSDACRSSCSTLGHNASLCDPIGCRCYDGVPTAEDAGDSGADAGVDASD